MANPIAEALVRIRPDTTAFRLETQRGVSAALTGVGGLGALGSSLRFTGVAAGIGVLALATKEAVTSAADLEQELNVLQATAQATDEEMQRIADTARELGSDLRLPGVTALDATDAMLELVKGGVAVQEAIDGARGTLQLGTATNIAFADSATIVARALTTFRLPGEDATKVADLLVGAAQAATGEVGDMAEALSAGGVTAAQFGVSLQDTVTAITLLAKNGIVGAEAGTGIRRVLQQLIPTTKEQADLFAELGVQAFDAQGQFRGFAPVIQDFQTAFKGLTDEAQADTLNKLFGTFGIQAASALISGAADSFRTLGTELNRGGQAAEFSEAHTKGLTGAAGNLQSQMETLGTTLGTLATPKLTEFVTQAATGVGNVSDLVVEVTALGEAFGDLEVDIKPFIGRDFTLGEVFGKLVGVAPGIKQIRDLGAALDFLNDKFGPDEFTGKPLKIEFGALGQLLEGVTKQGEALGDGLGGGIAKGIISAEEEAVNAARQTLAQVIREGDRAVAEAIRQGNEAVRLSAISARQNLISIGNELAGQAVQLIDEGPLAQRIAELRASLGDRTQGNQRQRLRESLADAQRELRQAEESIVTGQGPLTRAQQESIDEFIDPLKRKVRDAQAALAEFNTEGVISELEEQAQKQKETVQRGLADLVVQFNKGLLNVQQVNARAAALLAANGVEPYGIAGTKLGLAFVANFEAQLKGLREQTLEIARGIDVSEIGVEPTIVSPAGERGAQDRNIAATRQSAAQQVADARLNLIQATNAQKREVEKNSTELGKNTAAVQGLSILLQPGNTAKKGSDTKQPVPVSGR